MTVALNLNNVHMTEQDTEIFKYITHVQKSSKMLQGEVIHLIWSVRECWWSCLETES